MTENILPELKKFIIEFCKKQKIKYVDFERISIETNVEIDLNIFDVEADLFLTEFVEKFNVDYSEFSWAKYGYPKGNIIVGLLLVLFGSTSFVKKIANQLGHSNFKVKNLQRAILTGKLS